jgi:hypothetical protein
MNERKNKVLDVDGIMIPIDKLTSRKEAYRYATSPGWGTVDVGQLNDDLYCDDDCSAVLIDESGKQCCIMPYEKLEPAKWTKLKDCRAIILSDSCGYTFWEACQGLVKIYASRNGNGMIESYRLTGWAERPYDGEVEMMFDDLKTVEN